MKNGIVRIWIVGWILGVASLASLPVYGQTDDLAPNWTLSLGLNAVQGIENRDEFNNAGTGTDALGAAVSLERSQGLWSVGAAVATSERDLGFPDTVDVESDLSLSLAAWVTRSFGPYYVTVSGDYGLERFDAVITETVIDPLLEGEPTLDGDTEFFGFGVGVARTYGETTRFTPTATVGWSRSVSTNVTSAESVFDAIGAIDIDTEDTASGASGALGASLAYDLNQHVTVYGAGSGNVAQNEAATLRTGFGRRGAIAPVSSDSSDAVAWADVGAGLIFYVGQTTISIDALATIGQEEDFVTTGLTLSRTF